MLLDPVVPVSAAFNSPAVWLAAIGVIGTFLSGLVQIALALIARTKHAEIADKLEVVRQDVNGQTAKLLQVSGDAREAKGKLAGIAEQKQEENK